MARVLLLFNAPVLPEEHPDSESERDLLNTVNAVDSALREYHHEVISLGLSNSPELLIQKVKTDKPDIVFNLFEGFGNSPASEYHVAGLLNWMNIPMTGCPIEAMVFGRDKIRTKLLLRGAGLPTAEFSVVQADREITHPVAWPVIVKPAGTDASIGIDQNSVVTNANDLHRQVSSLIERFGAPILVESYLPGPEFNVGIIESSSTSELKALPIAEMVYTPQPGVQWPIVSYASKWESGSAEDLAMQPRCPAQIGESIRHRLKEIALAAFRLIGCRDIARVDLRLDAQGLPNILEVNPNPDLGATAGLARMLNAADIPYAQFINQLVRNHLPS